MTTTTTSGLICPDPNDYSAIPLAEQSSAAAIDTTLNSFNTSLTAYNNSPWAIAVTTTSSTVSNTIADFVLHTQPTGGLSVHALAHTTTASGLSGLPTMTLPPAGWYLAGATLNFQSTGVANANTRRDIILTWSYSISGTSQWDQQSAHSYYESGVTPDSGSVTGLFYADGLRNYTLSVVFVHKNTSSTMQVNTGARYWVQYLGTGRVI